MSKDYAYYLGVVSSYFYPGVVVMPLQCAIRLRPFCVCRFGENFISMTDNRTHIKNGIHRLYHQASKLNLYVQNAKRLDDARVATELKKLSIQLNELSNQPQLKQGETVSKKE